MGQPDFLDVAHEDTIIAVKESKITIANNFFI